MRKVLIVAAVLTGIGGLVAAAQASQDRAPETHGTQVTTQTGRFHQDGEHISAPREERTHEACEQRQEERGEADEKVEDEDRD
jgi:hypothetical protein